MGRSPSIMISATDNFSDAVVSMRNATKAFSKDIEGTKAKLDALNNTKASLKVDSRIATENIRETEKALKSAKEGTEEYSKALARLEEAYSDENRIAANLKLVSDAAKEAEKDLLSLSDANSKLENRAGGGGEGSNMLSALAKSGAVGMIGNALSGAASAYFGSAYGREAGTYFDSALSGASMGAAIGTAIAPGIGTAIGALGGTLVGLFQGSTKVFETKDDAFKSYYQGLYDETTGAQSQSLASGTGIAASRESDLVALETLLQGDAKAAREFQKTLIEIGRTPPFSYEMVSDLSRGMLALGYTTEQVEERMGSLADAAFALNMSGSKVASVASMLDSAIEMGKFDSRLIRTLTQEGIDVNKALMEAFREYGGGDMLTEDGIAKFLDELGKNGVSVDEVVDAVYRDMGTAFEGAAAKAADTYSGLLGILDSYKADMDAAMGEGYNEARSAGMREQISYLEGEGGGMMKEANRLMGEWQASLENRKEEYQRKAMEALMGGQIYGTGFSEEAKDRIRRMRSEYLGLMESGSDDAGAKMGALLAEAQALAINEYNASEGAQLQLNTQLDLANRIKEDAALNEAYWDAGYQMAEQFSQGLGKGIMDRLGDAISNPIATIGNSDAKWWEKAAAALSFGPGTVMFGHAYGLDRVPYDDYPALLHEGERVLTASQARQQGGGGAQITITGNNFNVREEADVSRVASELARQIARAQMLAV